MTTLRWFFDRCAMCHAPRFLHFVTRSQFTEPAGRVSVYDLWERIREHPDYVVGSIFTVDDLPDPAALGDAARRIEDAMTAAGFDAAENLGVVAR